MTPEICFLITIFCNDSGAIEAGACVHKVALKIEDRNAHGDLADYPMEPENRQKLHQMLPAHIRTIGPIVDIKHLNDVILAV